LRRGPSITELPLLGPLRAGELRRIPEGLIKRAFGHVRAPSRGPSPLAPFFLTADGGTIFLDEISELSPGLQVKLLRILQDKEVVMVGATQSRKVDVRILAATNKDLRRLVERQAFREDLYFRLNVLAIEVPPLRERGDDVLLLARHFLQKFARELGRGEPRFSDAVLDSLLAYPWPGNVRELENIVQRLVVMAEGEEIDVPGLPSAMRFSADRLAPTPHPGRGRGRAHPRRPGKRQWQQDPGLQDPRDRSEDSP
jgi:DNA-binding NtrC family response regulator